MVPRSSWTVLVVKVNRNRNSGKDNVHDGSVSPVPGKPVGRPCPPHRESGLAPVDFDSCRSALRGSTSSQWRQDWLFGAPRPWLAFGHRPTYCPTRKRLASRQYSPNKHARFVVKNSSPP